MSKYKYEGFGVIRNTERYFQYHTDDIAELLEEKDQQIVDLEAKFAESEKQRQHLKDWLDNEILTSVDNESYYSTINEYEEEVKQLKQQLTITEKALELACKEELRGVGVYEEDYGSKEKFTQLIEEYMQEANEILKNEK